MDQSNGVPKIPLQQSTVVVSAIKDGTVVGSNEIVLSHGPGATDGQLIAEAIKLFCRAGGIMVDGPEGAVDYYPMVCFTWRFVAKRVTLALGIGSSSTH